MRIDDLEFRRLDNRPPEIVRWKMPHMKEYCYTVVVFVEDSEGWYMKTISDRIIDEDPEVLYKLMKYAFAVLNAEFELFE